jgi:hypothetical protein
MHTYHGVVFLSIHELPGEAVKGVWDLATLQMALMHPTLGLLICCLCMSKMEYLPSHILVCNCDFAFGL